MWSKYLKPWITLITKKANTETSAEVRQLKYRINYILRSCDMPKAMNLVS